MIDSHWLFFCFLCFVLGYIAGRVDLLFKQVPTHQSEQPQNFFSKHKREDVGAAAAQKQKTTAPEDIDTRVFVAPLVTKDIVKSDDVTIGNTAVIQDDIAKSVSKLSQLKGK